MRRIIIILLLGALVTPALFFGVTRLLHANESIKVGILCLIFSFIVFFALATSRKTIFAWASISAFCVLILYAFIFAAPSTVGRDSLVAVSKNIELIAESPCNNGDHQASCQMQLLRDSKNKEFIVQFKDLQLDAGHLFAYTQAGVLLGRVPQSGNRVLRTRQDVQEKIIIRDRLWHSDYARINLIR